MTKPLGAHVLNTLTRTSWLLVMLLATGSVHAEVLVQDVAHLQGEHCNRLMGFGLVVGLNGTGDGSSSLPTLRALAALHERYEQSVLTVDELAKANNVAIVTVEVELPKDGWRSGERFDVIVSAITAEDLTGGQLLATPLQVAPLPKNPPPGLDRIWSLAGGRIEIESGGVPTRGLIRDGAIMEFDRYHSYVQDGAITLVLSDGRTGWPMAQMLARAINDEVANPSGGGLYERDPSGELVQSGAPAVVLGPKSVRIQIPAYELSSPAGFITRVLQAPIFVLPRQQARVVINRSTNHITLTGSVSILPTVVQIPGLGTVSVGGGSDKGNTTSPVGLATENPESVEFQQLLSTLEQLKLAPEQMVQVVEQLHQTGTLQAELIYTE
jgi:flagellar P-ring protein precursor FlgI